MICLIALITFAILGIFSAKYKEYAKEAFDCVFRRLTLRKCNTAFDKKVRARASTKLMKRNKALGGFVFKHFETIGWIFTILLMVSLVYSAYTVYNLAIYGSCDPQTPETCVFTPNTVPDPNCTLETGPVEDCDGIECDLTNNGT